MIKTIKLENWKTHLKSEFSFDKGTNVIVGVMGSGKTSIMDAICFSLYGTFPSLNARKITLEQTIMQKPNKQEYAKLQLVFDYNDRTYRVERTIKKKGASEAVLYEEGKLINGPKSKEVNEKIEEITGVSYELFSLAVYSEQNEIDRFLKLNPSQRKQKFDELLQLDKYEAARSNAISVSNQLKRLLKEREARLEEAKKEFSEKELENARKRVTKIGEEAKEKQGKIIVLEKSVEEKNKELEELELLLTKLQEGRRKISVTEERNRMLEKRKQEDEVELKELKRKINVEKVKERINRAREEFGKIEKNGKALNAEVSEVSNKIGERNALIKQAEKSYEGLKKAGAKCPLCTRPLDEHTKKEIGEENTKIIEKCNEEKKKFLYEQDKIEEELNELRKKAREKNHEIALLEKELGEAEGITEKEKKLRELEQEINKTKEELEITEKEVSGIKVDEKKISSLREEAAAAKEKINSVKQKINSDKLLTEEISKGIESMKKKKKAIEENAKFVERSEKKLEKMKIFANALIATQTELRDHLIEAINEAMNDVWDRIYPYKDYTSAKITIEKTNYEVVVKDRPGNWVNAEGTLSGGERSSVALTLRIAIALVLTRNLGWLILDEPTHNLDSNAVAALSEMLKNHLPELVEQVFIITHDKQMEHAASADLYLLERDKSRDEPTRIAKNQE